MAKHERYAEYKASGIPWLEESPAHWKLMRLGYVAQTLVPMRDKPKALDGDIPWIRIEDFKGKFIDGSSSGQGVSQQTVDAMNLKVYPSGTVLCSCSCSMGATAIATRPLVSNQTFIGLVPSESVLSDFLYYQLAARAEDLQAQATGAIQQYLSRDDFRRLRILIPPLEEQQAIAAWLDERTTRIDTLIAKKQRLIELLQEKRQAIISKAVTRGLDPHVKLKDSGIPWLGEVPEHWEVKRFKHVVSVWGRIGFRGYTTDDLVNEGQGALALGASHITATGAVDTTDPVYVSWEKYYESPEIMIDKDDLIVVQRGSIGKVALVENDLGPATINPSLVLLKDAIAHPRFLLYVLLGGYIQSTITTLLNATAVPMLSQHQIENFLLLLPPPDEQEQIVAFIVDETGRIDALLKKAHLAMHRLQEYRSSLISAAVTGQIKVT